MFLLPNAAHPKPFNPAVSYCNVTKSPGPLNRACYGHDICYANPGDRSRLDCDKGFLRDCIALANGPQCPIMYGFIRTFGWSSWNRSREKDRQ
jgi:hypothetical protein